MKGKCTRLLTSADCFWFFKGADSVTKQLLRQSCGRVFGDVSEVSICFFYTKSNMTQINSCTHPRVNFFLWWVRVSLNCCERYLVVFSRTSSNALN